MKIRSLAATGLLLLALTACNSPQNNTPSSSASSSSELSLNDGWVKAVPDGDKMTAAFGTLKNNTDHELRVSSATSPAAPMVELHETVKDAAGQSQMQQNKNGFVIPAHGEFKLEPGANHIMFMQLPKGIKAGEEVSITLKTSDNKETLVRVPAKEFSGANENYSSSSPSPSMSM